MNKFGMIYFLGKDDIKWMIKFVKERDGRMKLGSGWIVFVEVNGFKIGEFVMLELVWEDGIFMIRFFCIGFNSFKDIKKELVFMEVMEFRMSGLFLEIYDWFVILILLFEDVKVGVLVSLLSNFCIRYELYIYSFCFEILIW